MEIKDMNIFQKMEAITTELGTVNKNLDVGTGKSSYKAVSERDVLDAVKPLESKYHIYSYAVDRKAIESGELVSTKTDYQTKQKYDAKQLWIRVETTYRFVNTDKPDEYIEIKTYGDGLDSGDKATGKAMTYADKYALLKAYKISTGDDPDQEESGELKTYTKKEAPNSPTTKGASTSNYTVDYRKKLIEYCQTNKIDMKEIAKKYGINGATTQERFKEVLKELGVE